jgi:hypothetical protein
MEAVEALVTPLEPHAALDRAIAVMDANSREDGPILASKNQDARAARLIMLNLASYHSCASMPNRIL